MSGAPRSAWQTYRRLLGYARRYWGLLALSGVGMLIEAAAAGAFTWLMKPMVNETFVARNPDVRLVLPLTIVGLFLARGLATFVTDVGMARTGRGVVRDLRRAMLEKYLRLPGPRFDLEPAAGMVSRLNYDTEQVAQASSESLKIILTDSLTLVALLAVMLSQSVRVTLAMLVLVPLMGVLSGAVARRYRRINRGIQDGVAQMAQTAEQALAAQQDVKVYAAQAAEAARYGALADRNLRLHVKVETTRAAASSITQLLAAVALAVILYVAGQEASAGRMDAGQFVALMTAMMAMLPSIKRMTSVQSAVQRGLTAADHLFAVLDSPDEPDTGRHRIEGRATGALRFEAASVTYDGQPRAALDGVSFEARPGTMTAIVGRSGSGKSTLVRLIPRLYDVTGGRVLLDGTDLRDIALADLRRQIALVSQKVMLFDDTVAANIAYGAGGTARPDAIRDAARAANALEFIERLPQGFDTRIGDNGALLSGGQRQRLAIARAFLKDAPILILDEATAALDSESERLVQDALAHLLPHRTTLVIAHRLATVEAADQVLVLDEGRLVEQGTHAGLLQHDGVYARLHRLQFRDSAEPG